MTGRAAIRRWAGALCLAAALAAVGWVLLGPDGEGYVLHARFESAGQLVDGASVKVAGRKVGKVTDIALTPHGQADVAMRLDRDAGRSLRQGTRARIRAVGQAAVTSRYVELTPGAQGARLPDAAVLSTAQTTGIVDLDQVLDLLDAPTRRSVRAVIGGGAAALDGEDLHRLLGRLEPAMAETAMLARDVAADRERLQTLVSSSAHVATALAERGDALDGAIRHGAVALTAVADQRDALDAVLTRAPALLRSATRTLRSTRTAALSLQPVLGDVPAVARPLGKLLRESAPTLDRLTPQIRRLNADLPALRRTLQLAPGFSGAALPALRSARSAVAGLRPMLPGLRAYAPDLILGLFNGLAGIATGNYDATGHYARLEFQVSPQSAISGAMSGLLSGRPLVPGLFDLRTRQLARCPGSATPPAPDGSTPWVPYRDLCDPTQTPPASVNTP